MLLDPTKTGGHSGKTTAPVHATPAYVAAQDPEFVDAAGLAARFGIKRSLAYCLLADHSIRGVSLRRPGNSVAKGCSMLRALGHF